MRSGVVCAVAPGCVHALAFRVAAVLLLGSAVAGCAAGGQPRFAGANATVAFEAIDGPPPAVFEKLVTKLNDEAQARQIPVVSRASPAQYRVRGYIAAQTDKKRNTIAWVWDVYDGAERRALRIAGEEPAGAPRRDAWASADDKVLARIAQNGMARIAEFLKTGAPAPVEAPVQDREREPVMTVASRDDFAPESAGIFRFFRGTEPRPAAQAPTAQSSMVQDPPPVLLAQVPVPRPRPEVARSLTEEDLIKYAASRR
jgi:hypothetical protein